MTTCQICGREIKAAKGRIAKHGYKRPGDGYQTASCFGAGFRPYEVSCDAIERYMVIVTESRVRTAARRVEMFTNPPATLDYIKRDAWGSVRVKKTNERPAGFDPKSTPLGSSRVGTYEDSWTSAINHMDRNVKMDGLTLEFLQERLDGWKGE